MIHRKRAVGDKGTESHNEIIIVFALVDCGSYVGESAVELQSLALQAIWLQWHCKKIWHLGPCYTLRLSSKQYITQVTVIFTVCLSRSGW